MSKSCQILTALRTPGVLVAVLLKQKGPLREVNTTSLAAHTLVYVCLVIQLFADFWIGAFAQNEISEPIFAWYHHLVSTNQFLEACGYTLELAGCIEYVEIRLVVLCRSELRL